MATALSKLPRFVILEPHGGIRLEVRLDGPACEIDLALDNPGEGRSFVLLIGHSGGPFVQRVRLSGRGQILFVPEKAGEYALVLSNPSSEAAVVRLKARSVAWAGEGPKTISVATPRKRSVHRRPPSSRSHAPRSPRASLRRRGTT